MNEDSHRAQDLFTVVRERSSVRSFRPDLIPLDLVRTAIEAAGWAPSPHGTQPWRFAVIASRFSLSIQHATGFKLDDDAAGQRTACLTGAWAGLTNRPDAAAGLRLSPGDLDEAVAELLADDSLIAADVNGKAVPSGFARVEAFGDGFFRGSSYCVKKYSI